MFTFDEPVEAGYAIGLLDEMDVSRDDVLALWARESVMPADTGRRRVDQVLLVATHEADGLVAVLTSYLVASVRLREDVWHMRTFVAPAHRRSHLTRQLSLRHLALVERRFVEGADRRGAGIVYELENSALRDARPLAVLDTIAAVSLGDNTRGTPIYVRWFEGAELS